MSGGLRLKRSFRPRPINVDTPLPIFPVEVLGDEADEASEHENECEVCGDTGSFICCDACSRVYHLHCLRPALMEVPPGRWECPYHAESHSSSLSSSRRRDRERDASPPPPPKAFGEMVTIAIPKFKEVAGYDSDTIVWEDVTDSENEVPAPKSPSKRGKKEPFPSDTHRSTPLRSRPEGAESEAEEDERGRSAHRSSADSSPRKPRGRSAQGNERETARPHLNGTVGRRRSLRLKNAANMDPHDHSESKKKFVFPPLPKLPKKKEVAVVKREPWKMPTNYISEASLFRAPRKVEYAYDDADELFLRKLNQGLVNKLSVDDFEKILDMLEKQAFSRRGQSNAMQRKMTEKNEEDAICGVCGDGDSEDGNLIVFCDGCDVAMHQKCYGITEIPEKEYLCDTCSVKAKNVSCVLCKQRGGVFKLTTDGRWVHMVCAIYIPEVEILNPVTMSPIKIGALQPRRASLICVHCKGAGACMQCVTRFCYESYHPYCALKKRQFMNIREEKFKRTIIIESHCLNHSRVKFAQLKRSSAADQDHLEELRLTCGWAIPLLQKLLSLPIFVLTAVADYWLEKRRIHPAPLLRRLQAQTFVPEDKSAAATSVQPVKDDPESMAAMRKIRQGFERARILLDLLKKREEVKKELMQLNKELAELQLSHPEIAKFPASSLKEGDAVEDTLNIRLVPLFAPPPSTPAVFSSPSSSLISPTTSSGRKRKIPELSIDTFSLTPSPAYTRRTTHDSIATASHNHKRSHKQTSMLDFVSKKRSLGHVDSEDEEVDIDDSMAEAKTVADGSAENSAVHSPLLNGHNGFSHALHCHFCKKKKFNVTICPKVDTHRFCPTCLTKRLGIDYDQVHADPLSVWPDGCPKCHDACPCSTCRFPPHLRAKSPKSSPGSSPPTSPDSQSKKNPFSPTSSNKKHPLSPSTPSGSRKLSVIALDLEQQEPVTKKSRKKS